MAERLTLGERFVSSKFIDKTSLGEKVKKRIVSEQKLSVRKKEYSISSVKSRIIFGQRRIFAWNVELKET